MNTRYSFLAATSILLATLGPLQGIAQIPTDGLVAYYPFNGNANDESGNGNNGTLVGGATTTTFLQLGDNASDALSLPYTILDGLTDLTFAAFLQIDQLHTEGGFLSGANVWMGGAAAWHPGGNGFNLTYDATIRHWRTLIVPPLQTNYFFDYDTTIEDHTWHHVAVTRQGTLATLYIDGTQVGFPTEVPDAAFDCDPGGFIIGQEQDYVGGGFQQVQSWAGRIDEFVIYNRPLSSSEISGLAGTMSAGLVAYYPFNGNANDESGNGNDGVVYGATLTADRFGNANSAYRFSGHNAYIDIGTDEMLRITGAITIATWIRVDDFPTWFWEIVGWGAGGDDEAANQVWNFHILNNSGNTYLRHSHETGDGINTDVISTRALQTDNWIHAAIVRNTLLKTYRFYINGVPEADISYELNPTGGTEGTAWIGWSPSGDPITAFNGIIDDIRIYNKTKSDSEVMEMYIEDGGLVSVNAASSQLPKEFSLLQNYPNPFNPSTTIRFSLPKAEHVKISIYDVLGELVGTAIDEERNAGTYSIKYSPENLSTGSYFYRMQAGAFVATKKFLLIR